MSFRNESDSEPDPEAEQQAIEARKNRKAARSGRKAALAESVKEALPEKRPFNPDDVHEFPRSAFQSFPKPGKGK